MRLIDADALLEEMVGITDGWLKPPKGWKCYEDSVRNAPTVEAEPVVHCKDCKYLQHVYWLDEKNGKKCILCAKHRFVGMRDPDWYCADGERREE